MLDTVMFFALQVAVALAFADAGTQTASFGHSTSTSFTLSGSYRHPSVKSAELLSLLEHE
jgi:hypothetical protein